MSLKQAVTELFEANSSYLNAQQAFNLAYSLKILSDDLYTDPIRFIYELIQNSDDAYHDSSVQNKIVHIAIVDNTYLIVANYGKPFSINDLRGVCCVGCGTKKHDRATTGYKGLGFKAVFSKSNYVLIVSKENCFRFEANAKEFQWDESWGNSQALWETLNGQKFEYPWQICPIWTSANEIPKPIQQWLMSRPEAVATVIRLKNVSETQAALRFLVDQPHTFMFLKHIKSIRLSMNLSSDTSLNISELKDGSLKIVGDEKKLISHWLLYSCQLSASDEVRQDPRLPKKYCEEKQVEMTLAARIDQNDKIEQIRGSDSVLFACLPTKISTYNLPILVNSKFLTDASREHIHIDSSWNKWLFSCIPCETFKWIKELMKDRKWSTKAYDLLPNKIPAKDVLADEYNKSYSLSMKQIPFLCNADKNHLCLNEAAIDITLFSSPNCLGHELVRHFLVKSSSSNLMLHRNPFVTNHHRLRNLGITQFTWEKCMEMLGSSEFLKRFTPQQDIQFINYIYNERNSTQIQKRLYEIPFIMDQYGILRKVIGTYFPSRISNADWLMPECIDVYVHRDVMAWLNTESAVKEWLRKLGMVEKNDMTFVEQHIIPHSHNYINQKNALITINRLLFLFQQGLLTTEHLLAMRKLKLLTKIGTLVPAHQLYFSTDYAPSIPLDNLNLDEELFLSESYLQIIEGESSPLLKHFFLWLGVRETIDFMMIEDGYQSELVSAYFFAQTAMFPNYILLQFKKRLTISLIEYTQINYEFSVFFWEHVLRYINVDRLNEPEEIIGRRRRFILNLPQWCVQTRACIPTTMGNQLPSIHVFSNDLRAIVGHYLPAFACDVRSNLPAWQRFFQFRTELSINDCLRILGLIHYEYESRQINDEDERRIQSIYAELIHILSKMKDSDRHKQRLMKPVNLLSAYENKFLLSNQLVFSNEDGLLLPPIVAQLRLSITNSENANRYLLFEMFNMKQVKMNDLVLPDDIDVQPACSLNSSLRNIQPYLFALAASRNITNHAIDYDFEIFEADRLELFYERTVPILQPVVHWDRNQLYVKRPWNSDQTFEALSKVLCEKLKLPPSFEQDFKFMLEAETTSAIDEHFSTQNISLHTGLLEDLLSVGGSREKFAAMIDRDNAKLFSNLKITNTMSSAEVLLSALEAQESQWSGKVYHFTHLENAAKILIDRMLKAREQLSTDDFKDSAAEKVIKATRHAVKNYVRFYFRPLTPTQRCNENLGSDDLIQRYGNKPMCPVPIFFCIDLRALLNIQNLQWKISLGNMASRHTQFDSTRDIVDQFDYRYVYADARTERGKYSSQQEFLIESMLDLNALNRDDITLVVQDENALHSLSYLVPNLDYSIRVDLKFFTGCNPRLLIDNSYLNPKRVAVYINNETGCSENGQVILQIISKHNIRSITGTLVGVFYCDDAITILGKKRICFIPETDDIKYAVYYKYKNSKWLIHTTYANPKYMPPKKEHHDDESRTDQ